ncbi:MAG: InlB B-repeat-containing protein, partial [Clostridia bacterium]|nr:InlB B-repeat-containing protein [Clostridia bacterium]
SQYYIASGSPSLTESVDTTKEGVVLADTDAHVIFDDITIVNNSDTGEPSIIAKGADVTLTKNVIVDTQNEKTLIIRANADSRSDIVGNTITIETPSALNIQACGFSSKISTITGNVVYNIGENANIKDFLIAGKGSANNIITGDVYVNITDNATVESINISDSSAKIDGNLYISVEDNATVSGSGITLTSGALTGNAVISILGGTVAGLSNTKVAGKTVVVIDEENASVTGTVNATSVVNYNGTLGTVTPTNDCTKLNIVPGENVKYVRITNGTDIKEYNKAGDEVTLASEGFTVDLAEGTTNVDFLTEGSEDTTVELTVTYVDEIGNGASSNTIEGGEITIKDAPTATGYTFVGWSDGENVYSAGSAYTLTVNTTFTAVWEKMLFSGGNGTENDPYIIANASDFKQLTDDVNGGETHTGVYFKQTANIDMAGVEGYNGMDESKYFRGYYDGAGHTINVNIVNTSGQSGIFSRISNLGYIINLGTTGTVSTAGKAAGIALYIHSNAKGASIINCWSSVNVISTSGNNVGGITGQINTSATLAVVANCYFTGTITSAGTSGIMCGNETGNTIANTIKPFKNNYFVGNSGYTEVKGAYERLSSDEISNAYKTLNENIATKDYGIDSELLMTWSETTSAGAAFGVPAPEKTYSVTYLTDKGTAPEGESDIVEGTSYKLADALIADGYTFMGWSDGVTTYEAGSSITITADVTFTAVWVENGPQEVIDTIKVTFARENGTSPTSFAKMYIYSDNTKDELITAIALENETTDTSEVTAEVTLLEGTYYAEVVKNGYLTFATEITVTDTFSMDEIKLIPGDIKGRFEDECGDGIIDIDDFTRVLRGFAKDATVELKAAVDINEDGSINVSDIGYIKANFGKTSANVK